jgi:NADP-dependent 3-hydroxy acid dehydrogenase YdfG
VYSKKHPGEIGVMQAFADQIAVVTGASSGIGKAIALRLAAQGATLCLIGRRAAALASVAQSAGAAAPRVLHCPADLTLDKDIQELLARLQRHYDRIDLLVHSAGAISLGQHETAPVEDFDRQYRTNVRAPYVLTQALLPMLRDSRGQIVFINSQAGLNARANMGQYAATKYALKALADSLREEVNAAGVRVLSVYPGRTASPMQVAMHAVEGKEYHPERLMQPDDVAAVVLQALSLPRSTEVTDIILRPLRKPGV